MKYRKLVGAILGGVTIVAPILTFFADAITKDREMDEIAERVVKKMNEEKNVQKENKDQN